MLKTIGGVGCGDRYTTATTHRWTRLLVAGLGCVLAARQRRPLGRHPGGPADYVAASTQPQSDPTMGPGDYGCYWWVTNETGHDSFRSIGFAGQLIPELDLVVVITSDYTQERFDAPNLVGATIAPAVTG